MPADAPPLTPIYLGLGSNLGDRAANLDAALRLLEPDGGPFQRSSVFVTPPWGDLDQPAFLNLVAKGHTRLSPEALLRRIKDVEREVGRTPTRHWGPRIVDVDILAFGDQIIRTPELEVPHARLHERGFVLVPLEELDPQWRHPVLGRTAAELLRALPAAETDGMHRWEGPDSG